MKPVWGKRFLRCAGLLMMFAAILAGAALPALAQESSPDASTTPIGHRLPVAEFHPGHRRSRLSHRQVWRALFPRPRGVDCKIDRRGRREACRGGAGAAQKRPKNWPASLVRSKKSSARRCANRPRTSERIRALAKTEAERIGQAARAEIDAAERAGAQELRAIAARLATERAAALIRDADERGGGGGAVQFLRGRTGAGRAMRTIAEHYADALADVAVAREKRRRR